MTIEQRILQVESVLNVRHLGGYETADGRRTRSDVIRAGSLHSITPAGAQSLAAAGITTVFDLRTESERSVHVSPELSAHGIRSEWRSVFAGASPTMLSEEFPGFAVMYREMLHSGKEAYRVLFEQLALSSGGFLFHCTAGKDRTGVAAALLLELAGVHDLVIADDYSHSATLIASLAQSWQPADGRAALSDETRRRLFTSNAEDMLTTLEYVRGCWGSSRGYMQAIGMREDLIARLRRRIVE